MGKLIMAMFLVMVCLLPATPAAAQISGSVGERQALLGELQSILTQLLNMRAQLYGQPNLAPVTNSPRLINLDERKGPYELSSSRYYRGAYEAVYLVRGTGLVPYGETVPKDSDIDLWNLWREVVGNRVIRDYLTEFRLYYDPDAPFDAFVEQLDTGNDWIFGVNIANIDVETNLAREAATELFIHEYAHIIYHYKADIREVFENTFWQRRSRNPRHYVSEYAMTNSEEDFAESFTHFVLYPKPTGNLTRNEKVLLFYDYRNMRELRAEIRDRLLN